MKVLSDFDGVLTDIAEEAHRVREIFTETLIHASGWEAKRIHLLMDRALEHLQKTPHEHGWRTEGRIAAYANEDSFLANIGLSHCLDALSLSENADFLKAVEALKAKNISSFNQVSLNAYQTMTIETKMGKRKPIDAEAVKFLKQL
ncbi:MAG: hypothetical protein Q7S68_02675, partial [Deltaproteobacteria bacterium]|nr:hypothetical protein [Deltaproteobacteria bacterium]